MAWLCVDEDGQELICDFKPIRLKDNLGRGYWSRKLDPIFHSIYLKKGTIKKLIGKNLTWEDEPYEYTEDVKKAKRKPNWNIGLLSLIWSSMVIILGNIAWKTGPWATGTIIILTSLIFYFGYRDTDINEKES